MTTEIQDDQQRKDDRQKTAQPPATATGRTCFGVPLRGVIRECRDGVELADGFAIVRPTGDNLNL